jgi:phenylacetate-CoA ligase
MNIDFFDSLETRSADQREAEQLVALRALIGNAARRAPAYQVLWRDLGLGTIYSLADLRKLPVVRKNALPSLRESVDPTDVFCGLSTIGWGTRQGALRVFASPGGLFEPEGGDPDYWHTARALFAADFRRGDLVHNSFSYHLTPAGAIMESGALALGCSVFPAGVGQTDLQVRALEALQPNGYVGTPSFLKILIDRCAELGAQRTSLRKALVTGEALMPSTASHLAAAGIAVRQCYASADAGLLAYETSAQEGLVVEEEVILEIVRPGTGDPVGPGEVGEVLVTTLRPDHPLIRFATGDLSAVLPGHCPTGRTNMRIRGWMGRADQSTKVRGMFVTPSQIEEIRLRFPTVARLRLLVSHERDEDQIELRAESAKPEQNLAEGLIQALRDLTRLRGNVVLVAPGYLPNDGKIIEDTRPISA